MMMNMKFIIWFCMWWFSGGNLSAKMTETAGKDSIPDPVSNPQFVAPLRIPLSLSANFCEVRKDHYHMGLDIRTQQRENIPVYAVEDGFVSRVGISNQGYGKVIYIQHPNGYTSLYAHLNSFYDELEQHIDEWQYRNESWEADVYFKADEFRVRKNQQIALSGNTGASAGPHLHFEIRETKTGRSVNPQLAGIAVTDKIPPSVYGVYVYDGSRSTYFQTPQKVTVMTGLLKVNSPTVRLAIRAEDRNNSSGFMMGFYAASVFHNNAEVFSIAFDRFPFPETRYVNAGIDYKEWALRGSKIQHLSRLPGNLHAAYTQNPSDGTINISDGKVHSIEVIVADIAGNKKTQRFNIQYTGAPSAPAYSNNFISPNRPARITAAGAELLLQPPSVYDTAALALEAENGSDKQAVSPTWRVGDASIPVHSAYTLKIKANKTADADRTIMIFTGLKNAKSTIKPQFEGGWYTGHFNKFGKVYVAEDTVPPKISLPAAGSKQAKSIAAVVTDDFGKLKYVRGEVDGRWVKFIPQGHRYTYVFDAHCEPGPHVLTITAEDVAGNIRTATTEFVRVHHLPAKKTTSPKKKKNVPSKKRR